MVIVTDKKYYLDNKRKQKLDLMIKRMTGSGTDDNIIIVDGDEGQGKTELCFGDCYYVSYETGRPYGIDNIFFKIDDAIKFASKTKDQIIHIDEGALNLLTTQWWNKSNQKFLQLVMMARKKRHFIIICIPKFYKLNQYLVEERSIALIHIYSRNNLQKGRFCYYTKKKKEMLYQDWKRKKIKTYARHSDFHGSFVIASKKIFTTEQMEQYEKKKDEAILSINQSTEKEKRDKFMEQRNKLLLFIKKDKGLSVRKMEKLTEEIGMKISNAQISNICPQNA